jgi:hypothetical protein
VLAEVSTKKNMRVLAIRMCCALILIVVWSSLQTAASQPAARGRVLHYEPEKITLKGRVVSRTFYGPPNYGENPKTDSRESQYILILDSTVDVVAGSDPTDQTERGVKRATLVVNDFAANPVRPLLGRRVLIEGTLFHAITGHHHTRVLITVSSIKRAK